MVTEGGEPRERPISFRGRAVEREIDARRDGSGQGRGAVAARDLSRFYALLGAELRGLSLSDAEALAVATALRGLPFDPETLAIVVRAAVEEAVRRGDAPSVDGPALVAKLRSLCPGQLFAVVDAVERASVLFAAGLGTAEALRQVGLVSD